MEEIMNICGRVYPVVEEVECNDQMIPVVDIQWMSDIKWQRLALEGRLKNRADYAKYVDDDVDAVIAHLECWLEEHDPKYHEWRSTVDAGTH